MSSSIIFTIRAATARDAQSITKLRVSASQSACRAALAEQPGSSGAADLHAAYWRDAIEFSEPQVYVALAGESVIGFVGFDRSRDKGTPPTTGEIWAIYVDPAHWGEGIGLALWDTAREGLLEEGCTKVTLWVPLANERALRFHELAGFKREMNSIKVVPMGSVKVEEIRLKRNLE